MDLLNFGFNHFDDAADAQQPGLFGAGDHHHFAPLDGAAAPAAAADDSTSSAGSIGSSSRCNSPAAFESLPRFDFGIDESKYAAGDLHGKLTAPASASRFGLSIMLPQNEETFAAPLAALPVAAAAAVAPLAPGPPLARPAVRRVQQPRAGVAVHRAAVAAPAGVVAAQAVSGRVVAAAVVDGTFSGPALPARVRSSEAAESVSSDDTGFFGGRPRLASISTASTPGSPVCASVVSGRGAFFGGASRAASPVSLLGKRKAAMASAVPAKRSRAGYANAPALPTQRMVLVYRGTEHGVAPAAPRTFVVTDESARIFTVTVGVEPSCSCRAFDSGALCEHLVFVFCRALKVPLSSPLVSQTRLTVAQLASIYGSAPEAQQQKHQNGAGRRRNSLVVRQGTDGRECSLCCESFNADNLSYCMSGCGTNFHQDCLKRWHAYTARTTTVVAAKVVSSGPSSSPKPAHKVHKVSPAAAAASASDVPRPAEPLGVEPACCPVCRCHWKEEDDHLEVASPTVSIDDMDSLGYASPLGGAQTFFDSFDFGGDMLVV